MSIKPGSRRTYFVLDPRCGKPPYRDRWYVKQPRVRSMLLHCSRDSTPIQTDLSKQTTLADLSSVVISNNQRADPYPDTWRPPQGHPDWPTPRGHPLEYLFSLPVFVDVSVPPIWITSARVRAETNRRVFVYFSLSASFPYCYGVIQRLAGSFKVVSKQNRFISVQR